MDAYMFQAAFICTDCCDAVKAQTPAPHGVDPDSPDECLYDSDDWPKVPYANGGGEADTPQHCDHCGVFLENSLTDYGVEYLCEVWLEFIDSGYGNLDALRTWARFYDYAWRDFDEHQEEQDMTDLQQRRHFELKAGA